MVSAQSAGSGEAGRRAVLLAAVAFTTHRSEILLSSVFCVSTRKSSYEQRVIELLIFNVIRPCFFISAPSDMTLTISLYGIDMR